MCVTPPPVPTPVGQTRTTIHANETPQIKGMEASGKDFVLRQASTRVGTAGSCLPPPYLGKTSDADDWGSHFVTWCKSTRKRCWPPGRGHCEQLNCLRTPTSEIPWTFLNHTVINGLRFKPLLWLSINYRWKQYWIKKKKKTKLFSG